MEKQDRPVEEGLMLNELVSSRFLRVNFVASIVVLACAVQANFFVAQPINDRAQLMIQTGQAGTVQAVRYSPDGSILASMRSDGVIGVWHVETGRLLRILNTEVVQGKNLEFSKDGRSLISDGPEAGIRIWDVESGRLLRTITRRERWLARPSVELWYDHIIPSPDGKSLAIVPIEGMEIQFFDLEKESVVRILKGTEDIFYSAAFSTDGRLFATAGAHERIQIWNAVTGAKLGELTGHNGSVNSIAFSPDGKSILSGGNDHSVRLWNVESMSEVRAFRGHSQAVLNVAFLDNGRSVVSAGKDWTVRIWDMANGKERSAIRDLGDTVVNFDISPNEKTIAIGFGTDGASLAIWDINSGKKQTVFTGYTQPICSVALSSDSRMLATGSCDKEIRIWDLERGEQTSTLDASSFFGNLAYSPDGNFIAGLGPDQAEKRGEVTLWSAGTGTKVRVFPGSNPEGLNVRFAFSPDGRLLASVSRKVIQIWNVETGALRRSITIKESKYMLALTFSRDGRRIAFGGSEGLIGIRNIDEAGGRPDIDMAPDNLAPVASLIFSQDDKSLTTASDRLRTWNAETGALVRTLELLVFSSLWGSFSPDGRLFFAQSVNLGKSWNTGYEAGIKVFDVEKGIELRTLVGHRGIASAFAVSNDGTTVLSGSYDGTARLWNLSDGQEIAALTSFDKNSWAVSTPSGLFDASTDGRAAMHFVVGTEPVALDQMKDLYYVPGLLRRAIKNDPLPKVELFSKMDLFPEVSFASPNAGQKQLELKVRNRGGGIGQVQILINGKEFVEDARPPKFNAKIKTTSLSVSLKDAPFIAGGENRIEVVARNETGSLSNRGTARSADDFVAGTPEVRAVPNIYMIVGGISEYAGSQLNLSFAAKDAEEMAKALVSGAVKLINNDKTKVHLRLLTSNGTRSGITFDIPDAKVLTATKNDFQNAFSDFKSATTNDIFIVYLAGHGISMVVNRDSSTAARDTYFYLTQEATTTDRSVLSIVTSRRAMTLSSEELKDLMKQNKALKQVLILDTCAAGAVATSIVTKRDLDPDQLRAIERLKDNTGFYVLMGSSSNAVSYEASKYGQGLLTYALLQGMKGAKLRDNQFADVEMLFGYAKETVEQLARNIGGIQRPETITPESSRSFDIGQFTEAERNAIRLESPKPLILRPALQNVGLKFDNLRLSSLLRAELRNVGFVQARGSAPIVFVDAEEMPDAITPAGDYTVNGEELSISVVLVRNNQRVGNEIRVNGKPSEMDALVKELVAKITSAASSLQK